MRVCVHVYDRVALTSSRPATKIVFPLSHATLPSRSLYFLFKITDVIEQAQHEAVDILAVPLGGGTGPYPDAYSVTLKVKRLAQKKLWQP